MLKQILIAIDQLFNALCCGYADETLSARTYRNKDVNAGWKILHSFINVLFFFQENHCYQAYLSEKERKHLPNEYQSMNETYLTEEEIERMLERLTNMTSKEAIKDYEKSENASQGVCHIVRFPKICENPNPYINRTWNTYKTTGVESSPKTNGIDV